MRLGKEAMEALQAEITGRLIPGDELLVAGAIALEGTEQIVKKEFDFLSSFFSEGFLYEALMLQKKYGVGREPKKSQAWALAEEYGASALYAMGEGGVLSALWKMAEASQVGLGADLRKIPVRQETIEITEKYEIDPYRLASKGALLIGISGGQGLAEEYLRRGIPAAVIGQTNKGNDRLLFSGENVRYLDRPREDEIKKIFK